MYLSAALKEAGHDTTTDLDGDILAASVMPGSEGVLELLEKVKDGRPVIVGGSDPTYNPEKYQLPWIDGVCRGDGEKAIVAFAEGKWKGTIIGDMTTEWPMPDRSIVYDKHLEHLNNPIRHFMISRGCPYNCAYCFNHAYRKLYKGQNVLRTPAPEDAVNEIKDTIDKWGGKFVYFQDDTFNLKQLFLDHFLPLYKEQIGLPFHCHLRAERVTDSQIKKLKDAGCYSARFAIETAGDKKQTLLNRGKITDDDCINAAMFLKKHDIKVMTQCITCLPDTTYEDDLATLELSKKCEPTYAWASIYQPYKGTQLGDYCYKKRIVLDEPGVFFSKSPLDIPDKEKRERLQRCFSLLVSEDNPEEWIYSKHRAEREQLIYGMQHQS